MLSLKLKPALVSIVVTAGLLSAAAPASAQPFFGLFKGELIGLEPNALGTQVGSEGVKANNLRGEAIDIIP